MQAFRKGLAVAVMLPALGLPSFSLAKPPATIQMTGRFCGQIWSGSLANYSVTILERAKDGSLSGTYSFEEPGRIPVTGTLVFLKSAHPRHAEFIWKDKYGTGHLIVKFSSSYEAFSGKWGPDNTPPYAIWDGKRCEGTQV